MWQERKIISSVNLVIFGREQDFFVVFLVINVHSSRTVMSRKEIRKKSSRVKVFLVSLCFHSFQEKKSVRNRKREKRSRKKYIEFKEFLRRQQWFWFIHSSLGK